MMPSVCHVVLNVSCPLSCFCVLLSPVCHVFNGVMSSTVYHVFPRVCCHPWCVLSPSVCPVTLSVMSPSVCPVTLSMSYHPQCVLSSLVCSVTLSVSCHPQCALSPSVCPVTPVCPVTLSALSPSVCPVTPSACHPQCVLSPSMCPVTLSVFCHPQCVLSPSVCHAAICCFQRCCRRAHCCATVRPCVCQSWVTTSRATPVLSPPCRQPPAVSPSWRVSLRKPRLPLPFLTENFISHLNLFSLKTLFLT